MTAMEAMLPSERPPTTGFSPGCADSICWRMKATSSRMACKPQPAITEQSAAPDSHVPAASPCTRCE
jgi:hypothetical protein